MQTLRMQRDINKQFKTSLPLAIHAGDRDTSDGEMERDQPDGKSSNLTCLRNMSQCTRGPGAICKESIAGVYSFAGRCALHYTLCMPHQLHNALPYIFYAVI